MLIGCALTLVALSAYVFLISSPPSYSALSGVAYAQNTESSRPDQVIPASHVYIPKIDSLFSYRTGDRSVLEDGAWHRYPERGGIGIGNFILAAHRYRSNLGLAGSRETSPLYHIDKLVVGDEIVVSDTNGQPHVYTVFESRAVNPDDVQVENYVGTKTHVLTLYSCTFGGVSDGRIVVRAAPKSVD